MAAKVGIIPLLGNVIASNNPLKQTALQMYCDLAHSSDLTRKILWENGGVHRFLALLSDQYWFRISLFSLSKWLSNDSGDVESLLVEGTSVEIIVDMFKSLEGLDFENCLEPLRDMVSKSTKLNQTLRRTPSFVQELLDRLKKRKTIVLLSLLKLLKLLYECCPQKEQKQFIEDYNLYHIVQEISNNSSMVLVKELSRQIMQLFVRAVV